MLSLAASATLTCDDCLQEAVCRSHWEEELDKRMVPIKVETQEDVDRSFGPGEQVHIHQAGYTQVPGFNSSFARFI